MSQSPLIQGTQLSLCLRDKLILSQVDIKVAKGEIVTLVGPNGAGKSCLIKLLLRLMLPTKGKVSSWPKLKIGYMPQKLQIDATLPLSVAHFLNLTSGPISVPMALAEVGVASLANRAMQALSGGELQRVLLARALRRAPDLLVLDEPAQGVDLMGQNELYDLIARIRAKQACGILMVSHDLNLVMAGTDTVVCLNQHVCCSGHPETVVHHPQFKALFHHAVPNLAVYKHEHDHSHSVTGPPIQLDKDETAT
jgi:zinc transport system ATP-binding protein